MTTDAQEVLRSVRALSLHEQLEVLQGLAQTLAPLEDASASFWSPASLDDLARSRNTPVISDIGALALPDDSPDETADDLIAYVREQRQADRKR